MHFYALPEWFILLVKQKSFVVILLHKPSPALTPNISIASLYTAVLLADVLTASVMRMREKLRHKENPKYLLSSIPEESGDAIDAASDKLDRVKQKPSDEVI